MHCNCIFIYKQESGQTVSAPCFYVVVVEYLIYVYGGIAEEEPSLGSEVVLQEGREKKPNK